MPQSAVNAHDMLWAFFMSINKLINKYGCLSRFYYFRSGVL
nr:MAG TPA: hypothetical protein [Caudoviricetes sp.]